MNEGHRGPPPFDREPDQHWLERFVLPYITDSALWPVLFAILGHVGVLLAMPMINVYRDGDLFSLAALILLAGGPCVALMRWEWDRDRKPGPLTWMVLLTWVLSVVLAVVAYKFGLY
ncbi:MAG: hypothetical protein GY898_07905 [Proteobacteria bacterium]|nr:hypothetical protein [Pseudomonadota bacterium]